MKKFLKKLKSLFWGDAPLKGGSAMLIFLTVLSTIALIISNVLAGKSFNVFNWQIGGAPVVMTCGILIFPVTYILSDLFSEVYGYSVSRRTNWIGFFMNVIFIFFICMGVLIPGANDYYEHVVSDGLIAGLGLDFLKGGQNLGSLGILLASFAAYIFGSWIDDLVFERLKRLTSKKKDNTAWFILRAVGSSFAGEIVDSIIFIPLLYLFTNAFGSTITNFGQVVAIILVQATLKTAYELIISPLTALLAKKLKAYEAKIKEENK